MKFTIGDNIDSDHCTALTHEFYRCDDAFKLFTFYAEKMIMESKNNLISYRAYNSYADFIHHLYEFLLGCHARDAKNTNITNKKGKERTKIIESYIKRHTKRVFKNFKDAILNGTAPSWVNDIKYYDIEIPEDFPEDFREYRNKVCGHVSYERSSKLSLSEFYQKYHKYLYHLYRDSIYWWGRKDEEFPALKEITEFSLMIEESCKDG